MKYYITDNTAPAVPLSEIPEASYAEFYTDQAAKLADARYHIAHYFALPLGDRLRFFCLLLGHRAGKEILPQVTDAAQCLSVMTAEVALGRNVANRCGKNA